MARIYSLLPAVILLLVSALSVAHAETRTWTGRNGKQLNAELVLDEGEFVRLRDTEGKEHQIKTTNLPVADVDFLNSIRGRANASAQADDQQQKSGPSGFRVGRCDFLGGAGEAFLSQYPLETLGFPLIRLFEKGCLRE